MHKPKFLVAIVRLLSALIQRNQLGIFGNINTLRTGAFKLFKCTFPGSKQFKSTFILCFFKNL